MCSIITGRTYKHGTKVSFSFSSWPHAPVNMAESMEEVNVGGGKCSKWHVCCAVLCYISYTKFRKPFEFFETSIASLDPETVQLPAFSILSAMFTGVCGPPEKLSLALVPCSNVLCMIVKLANTFKCRTSLIAGDSCTYMFIYFSQLIVFIGKVHSNWNFLG